MSWKKFTAFNSSPTASSYPDLPQSITYLRLFLGLAYGISLGFRENIPGTHLNGSIGIIFGLNVVTFLPILYMSFYLNVDTDTYKGLNFAGTFNGMAVMTLVWVIFFTMLHEEEEKILIDNLLNFTDDFVVGDSYGAGEGDMMDSINIGGAADSEF
mmetsp:Transcript_16334/g.19960  ORF Transcript_16334/g.19960 Transcript_16334/m.19960 type:complete len:156 (+) Transcript_16334:160-627(+)